MKWNVQKLHKESVFYTSSRMRTSIVNVQFCYLVAQITYKSVLERHTTVLCIHCVLFEIKLQRQIYTNFIGA